MRLTNTHTKSTTAGKACCFWESRLVTSFQAMFSFRLLSLEATKVWKPRAIRKEAMSESIRHDIQERVKMTKKR
jgi:hypothetical protein